MNEAQWQRTKEITADAFERDPSARAAFVESACGDDAEVREEVMRLISGVFERSADSFLQRPALDFHRLLDEWPAGPTFAPGETVGGRFHIDRFLGQGAMGEVYAASDMELHEVVALKTISPAIARSAHAIQRFKLEVKESRRITHPCVCRVYDLFSQNRPEGGDPVWFLTMKLLDGETLAEVLAKRGPLSFREALPLISDMVSGLAAAHDLGIVHRDFKPSNVILVKEGANSQRAVVTDFGLALDLSQDVQAGGDGTPAYMAPEQAAGSTVDVAADQFALGLVICELLAGSRPRLDPQLEAQSSRQLEGWLKSQSGYSLSGNARGVIRRCLQFRPERRFRQIRDVVPAIDGAKRRARWKWTGGIAAVAAAAASLFLAASPGPMVKGAVAITPQSGLSSSPRISPNGRWVVYSSNRTQPGNKDIWIQAAAGGEPRRLTAHRTEDSQPDVSPDGSLVAFRSERNGGGAYVINGDGTGERLLAPGGWQPVFSPDGRWIAYWIGLRDEAAPAAQLYVIPVAGGQPRRLAADFADARSPTWSPTGEFILFDGCKERGATVPGCTEWWLIRADGTGARNTGALALLKGLRIDALTLPQKSWRTGQVVFSAEHDAVFSLWGLPISTRTGLPGGAPRQLTSGESGEREPSTAEDGTIVFGRGTAAVHVWEVPLAPSDKAPIRVTYDPATDGCPSVSRDGRWMFLSRRMPGVRQIYVRDLKEKTEEMVARSPDDQLWPIASPDGERVVFEVRQKAGSSIWVVKRNGTGLRRLCATCSHPTSWFDSEHVLYTTATGQIALLSVEDASSQITLSSTSGVLGEADWNPQNGYVLFTVGKRAGARQVFAARLFSKAARESSEWLQLTSETESIEQPHWAPDGKAFYYLSRRDAANCIWGKSFPSPGEPFAVAHFHDLRLSPDRVSPLWRGLAVAQGSVYVNLGEVTDTLWLGKIYSVGFLPRLLQIRR